MSDEHKYGFGICPDEPQETFVRIAISCPGFFISFEATQERSSRVLEYMMKEALESKKELEESKHLPQTHTDLLPCPKCNMIPETRNWHTYCPKCGREAAFGETPFECEKIWNAMILAQTNAELTRGANKP